MVDISTQVHGDVIIINIDGEFYIESLDLTEKIWNEQVAKHPKIIGINCRNIKFIDSSAIGVLVKFLNASLKQRIELVFFDLSDTVRSVFKTAKLENFFKVIGKSQFESQYLK
jgi:anti-anti-sigma factor